MRKWDYQVILPSKWVSCIKAWEQVLAVLTFTYWTRQITEHPWLDLGTYWELKCRSFMIKPQSSFRVVMLGLLPGWNLGEDDSYTLDKKGIFLKELPLTKIFENKTHSLGHRPPYFSNLLIYCKGSYFV